MKVSAILAIATATLAAALPAKEAGTVVARGDFAGDARFDFGNQGYKNVGTLEVTGGCVKTREGANAAWITRGKRCRFYRDANCGSLIGGLDGLAGTNVMVRTSEVYNSATCWYG